MVHGVVCHYWLRLVEIVTARVQIAVVARKVAGGDLQPDPMPFLEGVGGDHGREGQLVDFPGFHEHLPIEPLAVAGTQNVVVQVVGGSLGIHVDEFQGEVSVLGVGCAGS